MDYGSVDTTLPFAACERRSCVNVSITNDDTLENIESFFVNLNRNRPESRITLDSTRGEIEILDDDDSMVIFYTCVVQSVSLYSCCGGCGGDILPYRRGARGSASVCYCVHAGQHCFLPSFL